MGNSTPQIASGKYHFDKSTAIHDTLRRMNKQRNFYLHNKASITADDVVLFVGSQSEHRNLGDDIEWIHRYISLPFDLAEFLRGDEQFLLPAVLLRRESIA